MTGWHRGNSMAWNPDLADYEKMARDAFVYQEIAYSNMEAKWRRARLRMERLFLTSWLVMACWLILEHAI
jgi:hypothetical protein